jgi:hypothetical protein
MIRLILDDFGSGVLFPTGTRIWSCLHNAHVGCRDHWTGGVKWQEREANTFSLNSAGINNEGAIPPLPYAFVPYFSSTRKLDTVACNICTNKQQTNPWRTIPSVDRCWSANLVPSFALRWMSRDQRGGSIPSVNLGFVDRSCYFFLQVAPNFCSWGRVDTVPDPLLVRESGSIGNRTWDFCICSHRGVMG